MRVLLVKLSSMGDVIHALPALTDAKQAIPDIQFDWVIDENFHEIANWHPSVNRIIKSAHRRWRSNIRHVMSNGELRQFYRTLRQCDYDLILDAQGNFKSALITRLAQSKTRAGLDKASAAERIASLAYQKHYHVKKGNHAIDRLRELFAKALNYSIPNTPADFAIGHDKLMPLAISLPENYLVFVPNASWESKWWPEAYWQALIKRAQEDNMHVVIPWGSVLEKERAQRLATNQNNVILLPKVTLSQAAYVIAHAKAAVCVDTGLGHLAAALNIPAISLYGATNPGLTGAVGNNQLHLHADFPCAPCYQKQCSYTKPSSQQPACFTTLPPDLVWEKLIGLLGPIYNSDSLYPSSHGQAHKSLHKF